MIAVMVSRVVSRSETINTDLWTAIKRALEEKIKGL
jgi:hypothetical protein